MRLTNPSVAALELPVGKDRLMVFDDEVKGFGVRVTQSGKAYFVQYRTKTGESRRETLGKAGVLSAADARKQAVDRLLRVRAGEDPRAKAKQDRQAPTLGSLIEPYLAERESEIGGAWFRDTKRYLTVSFEPLHKIPARDIMRADIHKQLQEIKRTSGDATANRAQAALSRFYVWLISTDVVNDNMVARVTKPAAEKSRERVLKPAELGAIWKACRDGDFGDIVRLLILTAQRREEVAAMVWDELDQAAAVWSLPGARTKNGKPHDVPLSPQALDIVARRPEILDRPYLFGEGTGPFSGFSKAKRALDERSGVTGWRLHDLRRTGSTLMGDVLKVQPHVVEAILNHISGSKASVAGIYNKSIYATEKRDALTLWGDYVARL